MTTRRDFALRNHTGRGGPFLAGQVQVGSQAEMPETGPPPPLHGYGVDIHQTWCRGYPRAAMAIQCTWRICRSCAASASPPGTSIALRFRTKPPILSASRTSPTAWTANFPWRGRRRLPRVAATDGDIDPVINLYNEKVWLLHGGRDFRVNKKAMDTVAEYYTAYAGPNNVAYKMLPDAAHAQITEDFGAHCPAPGADYISDCNYHSGPVRRSIHLRRHCADIA